MDVEKSVKSLSERLDPLERVVHLFAASLEEPALYDTLEWKGFRFKDPDVRHFCLLKSARAVSAVGASLELARKGYIQEIGVLIRTMIECTTHIDFVLQNPSSEKDRTLARSYIRAFFRDSERGVPGPTPWSQIRQGTVHSVLGTALDEFAAQLGEAENRVAAEKLYTNVYRTFSNYVHSKYPECMELYGGRPGRFHLRGMLNTPKEAEIVAILDTFMTTLAICMMSIVRAFDLDAAVENDPIAGKWYRNSSAENPG